MLWHILMMLPSRKLESSPTLLAGSCHNVDCFTHAWNAVFHECSIAWYLAVRVQRCNRYSRAPSCQLYGCTARVSASIQSYCSVRRPRLSCLVRDALTQRGAQYTRVNIMRYRTGMTLQTSGCRRCRYSISCSMYRMYFGRDCMLRRSSSRPCKRSLRDFSPVWRSLQVLQ
jgi:hypothetical protein